MSGQPKPRRGEKAGAPCLTRIGDNECTGCAACANGCPADALSMAGNREGFYRPVLDGTRCTDCGRCLAVCPVLTAMTAGPRCQPAPSEPEVFAAWSTDEAIHLSSSSGGVFSELARRVLAQSGAVCGCEWGPGWVPRHTLVRDWAGVARLRQSKYLPSFVDGRFYRGILALAQKGTPVLFCGTPCQVAGLASLAGADARNNLLLVDLVCHGVPSLRSFQRYVDWKFGGIAEVEGLTFRSKEISIQTIRVDSRRQGTYRAAVGADHWFRCSFVHHLFLQRACFACRFCHGPRQGDVTLGDFWGIPEAWHDKRGDSVLLANTDAGRGVAAALITDGNLRVQVSDWGTASRRSSRLRGEAWRVPALRRVAMWLLAHNAPFNWMRHLCLPYDACARLSARWQGLARYSLRRRGPP
jgi:coenzyme F420-reducing hydrogenase beta subunit